MIRIEPNSGAVEVVPSFYEFWMQNYLRELDRKAESRKTAEFLVKFHRKAEHEEIKG